ncbi:MAG: hypothetical protein M1608_01825 [Candidatus Omnitrophica bacterium]|nr:hypothetical protein [Candidatus Omnitrophota bacterium]
MTSPTPLPQANCARQEAARSENICLIQGAEQEPFAQWIDEAIALVEAPGCPLPVEPKSFDHRDKRREPHRSHSSAPATSGTGRTTTGDQQCAASPAAAGPMPTETLEFARPQPAVLNHSANRPREAFEHSVKPAGDVAVSDSASSFPSDCRDGNTPIARNEPPTGGQRPSPTSAMESPSRTPEPDAGETIKPCIYQAGTAVAMQVEPVKMPRNQADIATLTQQILPVASSEDGDCFSTVVSPKPLCLDTTVPACAMVGAGQGAAAFPGSVPVPAEAGPVLLESASPRSFIERVQSLILGQVLSFRQTGTRSWSAVLKTDDHTELTIHFRIQAGQVEAVAQLQHGDYNALNTHWNHLQTQLAGNGIRLAALEPPTTSDAGIMGNGSSGSPHHERQPAQTEPIAAVAESNTKPATSNSKKAQAARHGWEFWA